MNKIKTRYEKLPEAERQILKVCSILCPGEGVSLRKLCDIAGADNHVFATEMENIFHAGLMAEQSNMVYVPVETKEFVSKKTPMSANIINPILERLCEKTTLSLKDDLLQVKPFFHMATEMMNYIIKIPDGIDYDYEAYGHLLVNITHFYAVYNQPDLSISSNQELPIIKGIKMVKSQIDNNSMLFGLLCSSEAYILQAGFWYEDSIRLIEQSIAIESRHDNNADALSYCYMISALWYNNHGQIGDSLARAYQSWVTAQDEYQKDLAAIFVAYQLALLNEFDSCDNWMMRIDIESFPQFHPILFFYQLILSLKYSGDESLAEEYLRRAEWTLGQINYKAALIGSVYYVKSQIFQHWGLKKESNDFYRLYSYTTADHYKSSDGAMYVYTASEVERLTCIGAQTAAKRLANDKLDSLQLTNPGYSFSVKLEVCLSYIRHFRALGLSLAETYYELALDYAKQMIPSAESLSVIQNIFKDREIPESLTGVGLEWTFEYEHLQNMLADKDIPTSDIKMQIERLKELFPNHQKDLELINASLLDAHAAISALYKAISHVEQSEKFHVSLGAARIAVSMGLIYEAVDFFNIMLNTEGYKILCKYQQVDILIEMATNLENTGNRQEARLIWVQLEALARGTSKLEDVWQARGNCSFDHEQYTEALEYYDKCLAVVQPEQGLIDQRLSSIYAFRSSCFGALGNYQAAYDNAVKAKLYFPMEDYDAFNLDYNHGFFAICLKKYKEARAVLTRAKTLIRTEEEKISVDELLSILAMKKADREAYLKQILYNFDT